MLTGIHSLESFLQKLNRAGIQISLCAESFQAWLAWFKNWYVIAKEEVINTLASMNSVISLAPGSLVELTLDIIKSRKINKITKEIIKPYYFNKAQSLKYPHRELCNDIPWRVHKAEAMFLWLWFEDLPISSQELYERLKDQNVSVVPGHHFSRDLKIIGNIDSNVFE